MPAVSDNPAYNLVTILYKSEKPMEDGIKQSTANRGAGDYEDIEVYFKHTIEKNNSTGEGYYEPIECRL